MSVTNEQIAHMVEVLQERCRGSTRENRQSMTFNHVIAALQLRGDSDSGEGFAVG
jgi:hypothetical protein